jgi:hypothetical protein
MRVQSIEEAKKTPAMNATAPTARILDLERWIVMVGSEAVVDSLLLRAKTRQTYLQHIRPGAGAECFRPGAGTRHAYFFASSTIS